MILVILLSSLHAVVDADNPIAAGQELFDRVERDLGKALGKFENHDGLPEKRPWWDLIGVQV